LVVVCALVAFQAWAGSALMTNSSLPADNKRHAPADAHGSFVQPAQPAVTNDPVDLISGSWPSRDGHPPTGMDVLPQADDLSTNAGLPPNGPASTGRDSTPKSDGGLGFLFIGLGGGVLIFLCWRMARSPHTESGPIKAK
jgi:hypothetical protein